MFLSIILLALVGVFLGTVDAAKNVPRTSESHVEALIDWLCSKGGTFNSKLEIRRTDLNSKETRVGMFAKGNIERKDILLEIPLNCLITSGSPQVGDRVLLNYEEYGDWIGGEVVAHESESGNNTYDVKYDYGFKQMRVSSTSLQKEFDEALICDTIQNLITEIRLGADSEFSPYVRFLLDQEYVQLPSVWSQAGKDLLSHILEDGLPSLWATEWSLSEKCGEKNDPLEEKARTIQMQRGWDDILIPIYDILSHRNGHHLNTEHDSILWSKSVVVRASRDILAGEEIHTSYNFCAGCGGREGIYGTAEIFRDYGFVEQYPQLWLFPKFGIAFSIYQENQEDIKVKWIRSKPSREGMAYLEGQYWRLKHLAA